ncbi:MAG: amino acid adenylation domain-containing protein, partial [Chloroflexi bacterium]|nr:amino acid adenylation domain-containing protein [Chloroflexota bacterium]
EPNPLSPLPLHYADFVLWHQGWMQDGVMQTQLDYWQQQLKDAPTVLNLTVARPRPAMQTFTGAQTQFTLPDTVAQAIRELSQQHGVTLFMTLLAAFQTLLYRYSEQDDILVGAPIANRHFAETEDLIGFFVNTLVFRGQLHANISFVEFLQQVRETVLNAQMNQDLPFEKLVELISPQRNLSHSPLFQVMFVLQSEMDTAVSLPNLHISPLPLSGTVAKFDLTLIITEQRGGLRGTLEYNTDLFSEETMTRFWVHFGKLLTSIVANPDAPIAQLDLLTAAERREMLASWNETAVSHANHLCIHQYISQQAAKTPDHIALDFADEQVTYQELEKRTNQLAHCLIKAGVQPDTMVALCVERSIEMIVGVLGVMKAGGAYVPIDAAYPAQRIHYIIEDSQAPLLLTQSHLLAQLPDHQAQVICLDTVDTAVYPTHDPETAVSPDNLAYIIYTSGSTGRPKGVLVPHRGLLNVIKADQLTYQLTPQDRVLQFASLSFDASVYDILMALSVGATLQLATQAQILPGPDLLQLLQEKEITFATLMPSVIAALSDAALPALHTLAVAGEPCSTALVNRWGQNRRFFNLYGPTEASIWSTVAQCSPGQPQAPAIGKPISNTQLYVLNPFLQPVPVGVVGELHIGGAGITRGYHNRPDLTATRFIPDPFGGMPGARLYKTGDLVRYRANGDLEFVGRADNQIKIRGYRIELGEIAHALVQHDAVKEATAIVREDTPQQKRIVAYVIPHPGFGITPGELRSHLKQQLPDYMVPSAIVLIDTFPHTPNGKLDKDALPMPTTQRIIEIAYQPPQTATQQKIAAIMQEILQIDQVGIQDNFFDLGAHSLLLIQAHARLQEIFQREIAVIDLFRYATIESLSAYLSQDDNKKQQETATAIQQREQKRRAAMKRARQRKSRRR